MRESNWKGDTYYKGMWEGKKQMLIRKRRAYIVLSIVGIIAVVILVM